MRVVRQSYVGLFVTFAGLLALFELWIVQSAWFPINDDMLSLAITVDLTLGIPAIYYLLLVRTGRSPMISLAPVFIASVVLTNAILPSSHQMYLDRVEYVLPVVESVVLLVVALKFRGVLREYRRLRPTEVFASDTFAASLRGTFGSNRFVALLVTELSIPYYLVCGWFRHWRSRHTTHVAFTYHKKSGYGLILSLMSVLVALETIGLHLVIERWNSTAAWTLTILSLYSLAWMIADYHAARLQPIVLSDDRLYIRTGLRWRIDVAWANIAGIDTGRLNTKPSTDYLNAAVYGEPRFVIQLKQPVTAYGLFGIEKQIRRIGLTVDDFKLFQAELNKRVLVAAD